MAYYNNGFPTTYQPIYYPQQFQQVPMQSATQQTQAPQNGSSIIWVSGEAGAKAYLVAPNTTVQLWDSEKNTIYIKSADASGMPSMKTLDYTIREMPQPQNSPIQQQDPVVNPAAYATKDELAALNDQIGTLNSQISTLKKEIDEANEANARRRARRLEDE